MYELYFSICSDIVDIKSTHSVATMTTVLRDTVHSEKKFLQHILYSHWGFVSI